jgi:hypothetical protein
MGNRINNSPEHDIRYGIDPLFGGGLCLGRKVEIRGWCFDFNGHSLRGIRARLGSRVFVADRKQSRPSIADQHSDCADRHLADLSGFTVDIELPKGKSEVILEWKTQEGQWHELERIRIRVPLISRTIFQNLPGKLLNPRAHFSGNQSKRQITFFCSDRSEQLSLEPLAREARLRGYESVLSGDFLKQVDVGVYCNHRPDPSNSRLSIVMHHQMGQELWPECPSSEPNHWNYSPWNEFDIGFLPGRAWSQCWYSVSERAECKPRLGVFEVGVPKTDRAFGKNASFKKEVAQLRKALRLKDRPTVLYAPSHASPEKQDDFIRSLADLPLNLLIKYYPWPGEEDQVRVRQIADNYREQKDKGISFVDPEISILSCLALSDVMVSDESNTLIEALLFDVPGISVSDWMTPEVECYFGKHLPARSPSPPPCAIKTIRSELRTAVEETLQNRDQLRPRLRQHRDYYYNHLGKSSALAMDVIDAALCGSEWPIEPLLPRGSTISSCDIESV